MGAPLIAAGIAAGAQLLSSGISAYSQGRTNKKTREWNEKMYGIQRQDALADWTRQNDYNHPSAQMARLREAGLNPNLVYGNGATTTADAVRSTSMPSWNPRAPEFDLSSAAHSGLSAYFDTQIRQAQIDNLRTQNTVMQQEALLKAAQIISTTQGVETSKFDLGLKSELRQISVDAAKANLDKTKADTMFTLDQNERAAAMQSTSLQKAAEEILSMRAQRAMTADQRQKIYAEIENLKKDGRLKQLDIDLKRIGVQPGDSIYQRIIARILGGTGVVDGFKNWFDSKKGGSQKFSDSTILDWRGN